MRTPATTLFVLLTAAAVPVTAASTDSAQEVPEPARPNIVLILADDLGFGDVGAFGCPDIPTPNIDRLVAEGLRMDCAFAPMPVCSPSRSGLMTGLYPQRFGMKGNDQRGTPIPPDHPTLAETLRTSGYETAMVGRWDLGSLEQGPLDRGFETVAGRDTCKKSAAASPSGVTYMQKDGSYWTDRQADQVEEFVRRERSRPFLLYFAPLAVHFPVEDAPQHYLDRVPHGIEPPRRFLAATLIALDDAVGRLMNALRESGADDSTLVIFTSDNGGWAKDGARNLPWKGAKATEWEGGVHVPTAVRWPGRIPAGSTTSALVSLLDIYPTLVELSGSRPPAQLDGKSWCRLFTSPEQPHHEALFFQYHDRGINADSVRTPEWRYMRTPTSEFLHRMKDDPGEQNNLAEKEPAIRDSLRESLEQWVANLPPQSPIKRAPGGRTPGGTGWATAAPRAEPERD